MKQNAYTDLRLKMGKPPCLVLIREQYLDIDNRFRNEKREEFMKHMDEIIPWEAWTAISAPCCPNGKAVCLCGSGERCGGTEKEYFQISAQ